MAALSHLLLSLRHLLEGLLRLHAALHEEGLVFGEEGVRVDGLHGRVVAAVHGGAGGAVAGAVGEAAGAARAAGAAGAGGGRDEVGASPGPARAKLVLGGREGQESGKRVAREGHAPTHMCEQRGSQRCAKTLYETSSGSPVPRSPGSPVGRRGRSPVPGLSVLVVFLPRAVVHFLLELFRKRRHLVRSALCVACLRRSESSGGRAPLRKVFRVVQLEVLAELPPATLLLAPGGAVVGQVAVPVVVEETRHGGDKKGDKGRWPGGGMC